MTGDIQKINKTLFGEEAARVATWPLPFNPKGGGGSPPPTRLQTKPEALPEPIWMQEIETAKSKVGKKKKGRGATILANRLMQGRQILNTTQKLGE